MKRGTALAWLVTAIRSPLLASALQYLSCAQHDETWLVGGYMTVRRCSLRPCCGARCACWAVHCCRCYLPNNHSHSQIGCSVGYMTRVDYAVYGTSQGVCGNFHANPYTREHLRHAMQGDLCCFAAISVDSWRRFLLTVAIRRLWVQAAVCPRSLAKCLFLDVQPKPAALTCPITGNSPAAFTCRPATSPWTIATMVCE
jgi:hypothetical protein